MKMKKLSVKALMSLILSAILFLYAGRGIFCKQGKYCGGSCGGYSRAENRKCGRGKQCRKHSVR